MNSLPFGQNLLLWRRARGFTQAELALRARIPQPNLSDIERGRRDVSLRTLRALAVALGVRPGLLADGEPPQVGTAKPAALDRPALERIASAAAGRRVAVSPDERQLARHVSVLVRHHVFALQARRSAPRAGARSASLAWIELGARYPKAVIQSLVQRTLEATSRPWTRGKSTASSEF